MAEAQIPSVASYGFSQKRVWLRLSLRSCAAAPACSSLASLELGRASCHARDPTTSRSCARSAASWIRQSSWNRPYTFSTTWRVRRDRARSRRACSWRFAARTRITCSTRTDPDRRSATRTRSRQRLRCRRKWVERMSAASATEACRAVDWWKSTVRNYVTIMEVHPSPPSCTHSSLSLSLPFNLQEGHNSYQMYTIAIEQSRAANGSMTVPPVARFSSNIRLKLQI